MGSECVLEGSLSGKDRTWLGHSLAGDLGTGGLWKVCGLDSDPSSDSGTPCALRPRTRFLQCRSPGHREGRPPGCSTTGAQCGHAWGQAQSLQASAGVSFGPC